MHDLPGKTALVLARSIAERPSAGLRVGAERALVAWVLVRPDGSVGVLHTLPEHRGRGYAKAVVRCVMLQLRRLQLRLERDAAAAGADQAACAAAAAAARLRPYCHIKLGNAASEAVFERLGFASVGRVTWLMSTALAPRFALRPLDAGSAHEWADLLALVNRSYRQDDAFFVDQQRSSAEDLRAMAAEGVFFVGYRWAVSLEEVRAGAAAAGAGLEDAAPCPDALACSLDTEARPELVRRGARETRELLCCVYLKVSAGDASPFRHVKPKAAAAGAEAEAVVEAGLGAAAAPQQAVAYEAASAAGPSSAAAAAGAAATDAAAGGSGTPTCSIGMLTIEPALKRAGVGQRVLDFALRTARETYRCGGAECFVVSVKPWLQQW